MFKGMERRLPDNKQELFLYEHSYFVELYVLAPMEIRAKGETYEYLLDGDRRYNDYEIEYEHNDLLGQFICDVFIKALNFSFRFDILYIMEIEDEDAIAIMLCFPSLKTASLFSTAIHGFKRTPPDTEDKAIEVVEVSEFFPREDLPEEFESDLERLDYTLGRYMMEA